MQQHAAHTRIGYGHKRIERMQAQDLAGIGFVGVADESLHLRDGDCGWALFCRRAWGRACRPRQASPFWRIHRCHFQIAKLCRQAQPALAACAHVCQSLCAIRAQPAQQVGQPVKPARRHGFSLIPPFCTRQDHRCARNGLLEIMRLQSDPAIW